jgi:broad specificity phosphatase PhoE
MEQDSRQLQPLNFLEKIVLPIKNLSSLAPGVSKLPQFLDCRSICPHSQSTQSMGEASTDEAILPWQPQKAVVKTRFMSPFRFFIAWLSVFFGFVPDFLCKPDARGCLGFRTLRGTRSFKILLRLLLLLVLLPASCARRQSERDLPKEKAPAGRPFRRSGQQTVPSNETAAAQSQNARLRSRARTRPRTTPPTAWSGAFPAQKIFLARHGRTQMNRLGWINGQNAQDSLDPLGYKHRVGLFLLLRNRSLDAIMVSALRRTQQTAAPLAAHFGLKPRVYPELNEFAGGIFQGVCKGMMKRYPPDDPRSRCDATSADSWVKAAENFLVTEAKNAYKQGLSYRAPGGGESVLDVGRRLDSFLARFPAALREKTVLIVGHGGTNRFLLAKLMHWPLKTARKIRQKHTQLFRLQRQVDKKRPKLDVWMNNTWTTCPGPPDPKAGLACLNLKGKGKAKGK